MPRCAEDIPDSTLRLVAASGLGPRTVTMLRAAFDDDDDAVACASIDELRHIRGIGSARAAAIRSSLDTTDPDVQRKAMEAVGAGLILQVDDDYPPLLAMIDDAPLALWCRGRVEPEDQLAVAIVGSRNCTVYGREQAARFGRAIAQAGLTVVSGGAIGVDGAAHRAAIQAGGRTLAVLGSGVDELYPARHASLFESIADGKGAVLSEFPMGAPPRPGNFPRRNRILSGMCLGVLVVEAALRSGALITARLAAEEHNRDVLIVPGRVDSPASAGGLRALREGWGTIVLDHADVLETLESTRHLLLGAAEQRGRVPEASPATSLFELQLTEAQSGILAVLRGAAGIVDVESLATSLNAPVPRLLADLTLLELRGLVNREARGVSLSSRGRRIAGEEV